MSCGGECSQGNCGLSLHNTQLFVQSQWRVPQLVYLVYRVLVAVFFLVFIILSGFINYGWYSTQANKIKWFIYLTDWMFLILTVEVLSEAVLVVYSYCKPTTEENEDTCTPWYYKTVWVLYNIATDTGIVVTILYWALVYPSQKRQSYIFMNGILIEQERDLHYIDIIFHAGNSVYIVINLSITAIPIRIQHFWHPLLFGMTFAVFAAVYDLSGGTNAIGEPFIYTVLDWSSKPTSAALYSVVAVVVTIFTWLLLHALYLVRTTLAKYCGCVADKVDDGYTSYE